MARAACSARARSASTRSTRRSPTTLKRELSIGGEDPLTARYRLTQTYEFGREGWRIRIETETSMRATATDFLLTGTFAPTRTALAASRAGTRRSRATSSERTAGPKGTGRRATSEENDHSLGQHRWPSGPRWKPGGQKRPGPAIGWQWPCGPRQNPAPQPSATLTIAPLKLPKWRWRHRGARHRGDAERQSRAQENCLHHHPFLPD